MKALGRTARALCASRTARTPRAIRSDAAVALTADRRKYTTFRISDVENVKIARWADPPSATLSSQTRTNAGNATDDRPKFPPFLPALRQFYRQNQPLGLRPRSQGYCLGRLLRGHANGLGQAATPLTRIANKSSLSDGREIIAL
jgi:hypothetical protein